MTSICHCFELTKKFDNCYAPINQSLNGCMKHEKRRRMRHTCWWFFMNFVLRWLRVIIEDAILDETHLINVDRICVNIIRTVVLKLFVIKLQLKNYTIFAAHWNFSISFRDTEMPILNAKLCNLAADLEILVGTLHDCLGITDLEPSNL